MSQHTSDVHARSGALHREEGKDSPTTRNATANRDAAAERGSSGRDLRAVPTDPAGPQAEAPPQGSAPPAQPPASDGPGIEERLQKMESHNRRMKYVLALMFLVVGYMGFHEFLPENIIVQQKLMESKELKLIDNAGNTRMFLRMYSRVPVLQLLDSRGKPRLSLGMRFDDTPFIDLSDASGRTRATFELTESDKPTLRLYDENGEPTFKLN